LIPRLTAQSFSFASSVMARAYFLKRKNRRKTLFLVQSLNTHVGAILGREDLTSSALFERIANHAGLSRILVVNGHVWYRHGWSAIGGSVGLFVFVDLNACRWLLVWAVPTAPANQWMERKPTNIPCAKFLCGLEPRFDPEVQIGATSE